MRDSVSKKQLREFGILFGFCLPILIGWIIPYLGGHSFKVWTLGIGISTIIIGIFRPNLLLYLYKGWMKLGHTLGWLNSHFILGIIFLVVLQPIAFIMKFFNYDPLRTTKSNKKTYRETIEIKTIDLTRIF